MSVPPNVVKQDMAGNGYMEEGSLGKESGEREEWPPVTYLQLLHRELMAQLPGAGNDQVQGITWLCCLLLMKLPSNGLIQVLIQLVPGPDALMYRERGQMGWEDSRARLGYLDSPRFWC